MTPGEDGEQRGGDRRPKGKGGRSGASQGKRPGGPRGGSAPRGAGGGGAGGQQQQTPIEIAVRSTRNAARRHAEMLRNNEVRLACRSVLTGIVGAARGVSSPGELMAFVEQVLHVLESGPRASAQLPATMRAVVEFASADGGRKKDVLEMVRLVLRHGYVLAADHIPRQARDDGGFRSSALAEALADVAAVYMSDADFQKAAGAAG